MKTDYVRVFERVVFDGFGKAIRWERSVDGGPYEEIEWPGDLPFALLSPNSPVKWITREMLEPKGNA